MSRTIRTILIVTGLVLAVGIVAGSATAWWKYRQTVSVNPLIEPDGALTVTPAATAPLGTPMTVTMRYRCPWHRRPVEAILTPGAGLKPIGVPQIRRVGWGFGNAVWQISATVRPYRTGKLDGSTLETIFDRSENATAAETSKLTLPTLQITELKPDDLTKLAIAPPLTIRQLLTRRNWLIAGGAVLALLLALLLWWHWHRRRREAQKPMSPWQAALLELVGLRHALTEHTIKAEICFARLTDIVRGYLEKRFLLRAQQQTTEEFMDDMHRPGSPLQDEHRRFLRDFLAAADLVKFAGIPADGVLLDQAIGRAETLINQTKPGEENPS